MKDFLLGVMTVLLIAACLYIYGDGSYKELLVDTAVTPSPIITLFPVPTPVMAVVTPTTAPPPTAVIVPTMTVTPETAVTPAAGCLETVPYEMTVYDASGGVQGIYWVDECGGINDGPLPNGE